MLERPKHTLRSDRTRHPPAETVEKKPSFAKLMGYCHKSSLKKELQQAIVKICEEAGRVALQVLDMVFPAFLKDLIDALTEQAIVIAGSMFRDLFQQILGIYIRRFIEPEPKLDDWSREEIPCPIPNCNVRGQLNAFFRNSTIREARLTLSTKRDQRLLMSFWKPLQERNCSAKNNSRTNMFVIKKR